MFDSLTDRLGEVFDRLRRHGALTEADVGTALREIRIGQLSIYDVRASVLEHLDVSLLGMSLLSRLQGYEMRDGKLTITW